MLLDIVLLIAAAATAIVLLTPRVSRSTIWRAAVTPLASIIGSGFLVLGPVLNASYGGYAPAVMAALCLVAYGYGAAIRGNIAEIDRDPEGRSRLETRLETAASWSLALAYVVSVAYYLNLFGAFAVDLTPYKGRVAAQIVATGVFGVILAVGWRRGFAALERLEYVSVTIKLAIIAALLTGLVAYFGEKAVAGGLAFDALHKSGWGGLTLAFGLLITVQGFETSRYLGARYDAGERIRSMRVAQAVSTLIYLVYIVLLAYAFRTDDHPLTETAIIDVMRVVSPVLPALLVLAALSAQFSAAIADTGGSGGLVTELTRGRISQRQAYLALTVIGVGMTWAADVFDIIAYASRAFALYYALQAAIASAAAFRRRGGGVAGGFYVLLSALGVAIMVFGQAVEG